MNGDIAKLNARIDDLTGETEDKLEFLQGLVRNLEDRLNQEESDRERADTALQDNIDQVEREQS